MFYIYLPAVSWLHHQSEGAPLATPGGEKASQAPTGQLKTDCGGVSEVGPRAYIPTKVMWAVGFNLGCRYLGVGVKERRLSVVYET